MSNTIEILKSDLETVCDAVIDCLSWDINSESSHCFHCCADKPTVGEIQHQSDCPVLVAQDIKPRDA
jgi:hypothetical protein